MRISYEWLKELVDVPADPAELVAEFTRTGTEVEAVERVGAELENVVVGQVVEKRAHPDSDHMWVTKVDVGARNLGEDGSPEPLQIVCGAQNFEAGDKIVVAMIGAVLPGGVKIKRSKLRGVASCGMNCSERELGLGGDHAGIMILPADAPVGADFVEWRGLSDTVIDCEITPNRPDCLSMVGMAREVSAMLDVDAHVELPAVAREEGPGASELVDVEIADAALCSRYTARVVRGVKIGPSPDWLARRVVAAGSRPINNVVDVTNYVMYLTGQPLHAFDLGKLSEREGRRHIIVRGARDGETIVTLDGQKRALSAGMPLITDDGETPVGLAGTMGGLDSEIDEDTVDVLLESACFDAGAISRMSRNLDLISEASIRFERQVDAARCAEVADVAAALFESCCGATVCPGTVDVHPAPSAPVTITLRPERCRALAGAEIDDAFMTSRLARLGCGVSGNADGSLRVVAPTSRPDLTREVDLIEEVLRLWGEGDVEPTLPAARNHAGGLTAAQRLERRVGATLRACGLSETSTYCLTDEHDLDRLRMGEEGRGVAVEVLRPLVAGEGRLRRDLLPGLLRSVAYNRAHGVANVALYEIGRVFFGRAGASLPQEPAYVCGVLSGAWEDDQWNHKLPPLDFFDAKGVVERLLAELRIAKVRYRSADAGAYGWLQPGLAAEVLAGGAQLGWVGAVHPEVLEAFDVDAPVVAFELPMAQLERLARDRLPYEDVPTLPGVTVDLALVVDEGVTCEQVTQRIRSAGGRLLADVRLFDVYRDPVRVGEGRKSMAFSLTYRAADRTLTSEEVDRAHGRLVTKVMRSTGGEVRG